MGHSRRGWRPRRQASRGTAAGWSHVGRDASAIRTVTLVTARDGLPARQTGEWTEEKLFYVGRYIDIFTRAMKQKWSRRVYIDLFSGPGKCIIEGTAKEI